MVFVCYFSDPFVNIGGGWDVLLDKVEGFCGEDVDNVEGRWGGRFVWVVLWGMVEVLGCFLSYVISCFIADDVVVRRYLDDVDGFVEKDVCNGVQNA